jgi:hypothetical protein
LKIWQETYPVFNLSWAEKQLGVALSAALNVANRPEKTGIAREITKQKRNRIWVAHEIMDILLAENDSEESSD